MTGRALAAASSAAALDEVLAGQLVRPVFQPVVDLERGHAVGYEALARVEAGPLRSPAALFAAARAARRLPELDWLCRERAVAGARAAGLRYPLSLFVNAEPETLLAGEHDQARWGQFGDLRCYAELTERALTAQPGALLRAIDQIRAQDWGIALDDVGADPQSLALLPLIRPDVIKLDITLLQTQAAGQGDLDAARVLHSALHQAADTGAVVVAEGIETEQQLDLARALGAQYGQGYLLGRPGLLSPAVAHSPRAVPLLPRVMDRSVTPSPFAVVAGSTGTRRAGRAAVLEIARQLLTQACQLRPAPVVLVCVSDPALLTTTLTELLVSAQAPGALVGLVGSAAAPSRLPGLPCAALQPSDPAGDDFDVVIIGAYYKAALVARLAPDADADADAGWAAGPLDMALTFDSDLSSAAGHALLRRLL